MPVSKRTIWLEAVSQPAPTTVGSSSSSILFRIPSGKVVENDISIVNLSFTANPTTNDFLVAQSGWLSALSRLEIRNMHGVLLAECRNISQLATLLNLNSSSAKVNNIDVYENGNAVGVQINDQTGLQTMPHSLGNKVGITTNFFSLSLNKFLPYLNNCGLITTGLEVRLEFGGSLPGSTGATVNPGSKIMYSEINGVNVETAKTFNFIEIQPERISVPVASNTSAMNSFKQRIYSYAGKKLLKIFGLITRQPTTSDQTVVPYLNTLQSINFYNSGAQLISLDGISDNQIGMLCDVLGGDLSYPLNHTSRYRCELSQDTTMDDLSVNSVMTGSTESSLNYKGNHLLNAFALRLDGLVSKELQFQLDRWCDADKPSSADALYVWMFGLVEKQCQIDTNGNTKILNLD